MKYLGTLGIIFIYRLRLQNHQPNSGTKSMYSMWMALPKPLVAEKSVASIMDQRKYIYIYIYIYIYNIYIYIYIFIEYIYCIYIYIYMQVLLLLLPASYQAH